MIDTGRLKSPAVEIEATKIRASRRAPYCAEVELMLLAGINPNAYIFAGQDCWIRAKRRREVHGAGSALVLPGNANPSELRWPALDAVVVCWPASRQSDYRTKLQLAQALVRDGVRYAAIEHDPEWLNVWSSTGLGS